MQTCQEPSRQPSVLTFPSFLELESRGTTSCNPQQCFGLWFCVFASTPVIPIHAPSSRCGLKPFVYQCNRKNVCNFPSSILNISWCHTSAYHSVSSYYLICTITKSHGLTGSAVLNTRCILESLRQLSKCHGLGSILKAKELAFIRS